MPDWLQAATPKREPLGAGVHVHSSPIRSYPEAQETGGVDSIGAVVGVGEVVVEEVGAEEVDASGVVENDKGGAHVVSIRIWSVLLVSEPVSPAMTISSPRVNRERAASTTVIVLSLEGEGLSCEMFLTVNPVTKSGAWFPLPPSSWRAGM
jgi:hypothetical protein